MRFAILFFYVVFAASFLDFDRPFWLIAVVVVFGFALALILLLINPKPRHPYHVSSRAPRSTNLLKQASVRKQLR